jgi:hypothetical protein
MVYAQDGSGPELSYLLSGREPNERGRSADSRSNSGGGDEKVLTNRVVGCDALLGATGDLAGYGSNYQTRLVTARADSRSKYQPGGAI